MFTAIGVQQGNIVTDGLNAWFDFGNTECYLPSEGTSSVITAGTIFNNLAPGQSAVSGTISGDVNFSNAFGGCMNLTNGLTSTLEYTAGLSASFTTQVVVTPTTNDYPSGSWGNDRGAWPGARFDNGFLWAQGNDSFATPDRNNLIPILWAGTSASTLPSSTFQPADGWWEYMRFPNVYTFTTNGNDSHNTYTNNILKGTDTTTRTRGDSAVNTIYLNYDNAVSERHGTGRICAYLHYNRQLSDGEIYQNVQYYLNRFGVK
jgi:hypothetical protein